MRQTLIPKETVKKKKKKKKLMEGEERTKKKKNLTELTKCSSHISY